MRQEAYTSVLQPPPRGEQRRPSASASNRRKLYALSRSEAANVMAARFP
jgi:hypothetical protein